MLAVISAGGPVIPAATIVIPAKAGIQSLASDGYSWVGTVEFGLFEHGFVNRRRRGSLMNRAERRRMAREGKQRRARKGAQQNLRREDGWREVGLDPDLATSGSRQRCEQGHHEQFEAMLQGIPPRECPRCGETPVFGPIEQNIDPNLPGYIGEDTENDDGMVRIPKDTLQILVNTVRKHVDMSDNRNVAVLHATAVADEAIKWGEPSDDGFVSGMHLGDSELIDRQFP